MFFLRLFWAHLIVEGRDLVGEGTVFVHQEAVASLLLQQGFHTAVRHEVLHVQLAAAQCLQALEQTSRQ